MWIGAAHPQTREPARGVHAAVADALADGIVTLRRYVGEAQNNITFDVIFLFPLYYYFVNKFLINTNG